MSIQYTITRKSPSWSPSMGGVGMAFADETTKVHWQDAGETTLIVVGTAAVVDHRGKRHHLKWICGSHEAVVAYWTPRIQKRLERTRLADRVRGGIQSDQIEEHLEAWNINRARKANA